VQPVLRAPANAEKKDNNEDEGRAKKNRRISTRRRVGAGDGGGGGGERGTGSGGRGRMKGEKKEETAGEAKAGNLDRVDHPLEPRADSGGGRPAPDGAPSPLPPAALAKIWNLTRSK